MKFGNKLIIFLLVFLFLLGAVASIYLYSNTQQEGQISSISIVNTRQDLKVNLVYKEILDSYLDDWSSESIKDDDGKTFILKPDGKGLVEAKLKSVKIENASSPQQYEFYDIETESIPVISFSHSVVKDTLLVSVYINKEYFDKISDLETKNKRVSVSIINYIYKVTHPSPPYDLEETQLKFQENATKIYDESYMFTLE
jgi:hypothetical protein